MANTPVFELKLFLTSNIIRLSQAWEKAPYLLAVTIVRSPKVLCMESRGDSDSGSAIGSILRGEHCEFFDLTTDKVVGHEDFPGTCEPREEIARSNITEIRQEEPHVEHLCLSKHNVFADPVNRLEVGHRYRITLKPQRIWMFNGSQYDLLRGKEWIPVGEAEKLPGGAYRTLSCDDELFVEVVE